MTWGRKTRSRDEQGVAAVEFALVAPVLLLIVFGLIQYGLYFWALQGGSDVARDAARRAAVGDPAACTAFVNQVTGEISDYREPSSPLTIHRSYEDDAGSAVADADVAPGDFVTVTVEFDSHDLNIPLVPFVNDGTVYQTATSRVEYVPATPETCA